MKKLIRTGFGLFLVGLGIIGLILPIMPGWIFLIPGMVILSERFSSVRRLSDWAKRKARLGEGK